MCFTFLCFRCNNAIFAHIDDGKKLDSLARGHVAKYLEQGYEMKKMLNDYIIFCKCGGKNDNN